MVDTTPNDSGDRRSEGSSRPDRYSKNENTGHDRRAEGESRPDRYPNPAGVPQKFTVSRLLSMKLNMATALIGAVIIAGVGLGSFLLTDKLVTNKNANAPLADTLNLDIKVECLESKAVFKITNKGKRWLNKADMRFYGVSDQRLLSKRQLLLATGQNVTFKVNTANVGPDGVGLWVKPSWYERDFKYDAAMNCP